MADLFHHDYADLGDVRLHSVTAGRGPAIVVSLLSNRGGASPKTFAAALSRIAVTGSQRRSPTGSSSNLMPSSARPENRDRSLTGPNRRRRQARRCPARDIPGTRAYFVANQTVAPADPVFSLCIVPAATSQESPGP